MPLEDFARRVEDVLLGIKRDIVRIVRARCHAQRLKCAFISVEDEYMDAVTARRAEEGRISGQRPHKDKHSPAHGSRPGIAGGLPLARSSPPVYRGKIERPHLSRNRAGYQ